MSRLFTPADTLGSIGVPVTSAPFTACAWAKSSSATAHQNVFVFGSTEFWAVFLAGNETGDPAQLIIEDDPNPVLEVVTNNGYSINTWHHVAMIEASATDHRIILDGDIANQGTSSTNMSPDSLLASAIARSSMNGNVGHVAVWNVVLSDNEIISLAAGVSPLRIRRDNLINYWPINGQSPEIDIVGGLSMMISGNPTKNEEPLITDSIVAP